jgi:hypothetical protein
MKFLLCFPIIFLTGAAQAQDFVKDLEKVTKHVSQNQIEEYVVSPKPEGLSGSFIQNLIKRPSQVSEVQCEDEEEEKNTRYEVIVVAEGNSPTGEVSVLQPQTTLIHTNDLRALLEKVPPGPESKGLDKNSLLNRSTEIWNQIPALHESAFSPLTPIGREVFIESLVQASSQTNLSEMELTQSLAKVIGEVYKTEEERYDALSTLSLRLYRTYNTSRNPGYNNPKNNPYDAPLPKGDMTVNELMKSTAEFSVFDSGVCNDITEAVAMVGEILFPDKDVLTVNGGTHFGVVITDGNKTRVIDGKSQYDMTNALMLHPNLSPSNMRINQVVNGRQREIAVVDTEIGEVVETALQTGKKLLKTDADISSVMAHTKYVTAGVAKLRESEVVIVVAKYEHSGDRVRSYVGGGFTAQEFHAGDIPAKYQVHLRTGVEGSYIRYVNDKAEIDVSTGVRVGASTTINQPRNALGGYAILDMSGNIDFYNRIDARYGKHNADGVQVDASLEVEHTLGPSNWGELTGVTSYMEASDTGDIIKNMSFHLNQVNANVDVSKKVNSKMSVVGGVEYQGSNIGQRALARMGLDIKAPSGAEILVFTGYGRTDLKGYKTKHSLIQGDDGVQIGMKYRSPGGVEVGISAKDVGGEETTYQGTLKVPLGQKKKK